MPRVRVVTERDVRRAVRDGTREIDITGAVVTPSARDVAAREGLTVVPLCPFARGWLERHPDVAARATVDWGQG